MLVQKKWYNVKIGKGVRKGVKLLGICLIIATVILPIAMYGSTVDVAEVSFRLSAFSASAGLSVETKQIPSFHVEMSDVAIDVSRMSPHEYMLMRQQGRVLVSEGDTPAGGIVQITMTFELTTPANTTRQFILTPGRSTEMGQSDVVVILGPEDGLSMSGEFHLTITIAIRVTPVGFNNPVVDRTLEPVSMAFMVP